MEHKFKKQFGQNFLTDKNLLDAIVRDANVEAREVLEIGAGAGALTSALDKVAKKVVSYEIDSELMQPLAELELSRTQFIFKDALKTPMSEIEKNFDGDYCLVANLPYYITSPLILKFLEEGSRITSLTIMVQKEVAERIIATKGKDYGVLSILVAFYGKAKITRFVDRKMFYPVPNVDSAVVRIDIDKRKDVDGKAFARFVKAAFSMRRKTLLNNLVSAGFNKEFLNKNLGSEILALRAESLTLEKLIEIFKIIEK